MCFLPVPVRCGVVRPCNAPPSWLAALVEARSQCKREIICIAVELVREIECSRFCVFHLLGLFRDGTEHVLCFFRHLNGDSTVPQAVHFLYNQLLPTPSLSFIFNIDVSSPCGSPYFDSNSPGLQAVGF